MRLYIAIHELQNRVKQNSINQSIHTYQYPHTYTSINAHKHTQTHPYTSSHTNTHLRSAELPVFTHLGANFAAHALIQHCACHARLRLLTLVHDAVTALLGHLLTDCHRQQPQQHDRRTIHRQKRPTIAKRKTITAKNARVFQLILQTVLQTCSFTGSQPFCAYVAYTALLLLLLWGVLQSIQMAVAVRISREKLCAWVEKLVLRQWVSA